MLDAADLVILPLARGARPFRRGRFGLLATLIFPQKFPVCGRFVFRGPFKLRHFCRESMEFRNPVDPGKSRRGPSAPVVARPECRAGATLPTGNRAAAGPSSRGGGTGKLKYLGENTEP